MVITLRLHCSRWFAGTRLLLLPPLLPLLPPLLLLLPPPLLLLRPLLLLLLVTAKACVGAEVLQFEQGRALAESGATRVCVAVTAAPDSAVTAAPDSTVTAGASDADDDAPVWKRPR